MPNPIRSLRSGSPLSLSLTSGGLHLFRLFQIDVFMHWSWFVVAFYMLSRWDQNHRSFLWNAAEYVTLFVIVTMHEFGHALACKSVGGSAERIILWPLGGVAFVRPPGRAGALLWSIAAGPLVNVVLLAPIAAAQLLRPHVSEDFGDYLWFLGIANTVILIFNLLPVYPLDGGQMLYSLLWFVIGRGRGLIVATLIGMIGAAAFAVGAVWRADYWLGLMAAFGAWQSWKGFQRGKAIRMVEKTPLRTGIRCPACNASPPAGDFWLCQCGQRLDVFAMRGVCPNCHANCADVPCNRCGSISSIEAWLPENAPPDTVSPTLLHLSSLAKDFTSVSPANDPGSLVAPSRSSADAARAP